jgi:hypothetical protein
MALKKYIEDAGGKVVFATSMAVATRQQTGYGGHLFPKKESIEILQKKFGNKLLDFLKEEKLIDKSYEELSNSQIKYLSIFSSVDSIRDRFSSKRQERDNQENERAFLKKAFDNLLQRDLDKQDRYNEESAKYLLNNPDKNIVNVSESKPSVLSVEDAFKSIDRSDNVKSRQLSNAASNLNKLFSANVEDKQEEAKTPVRIRERKQDPLSKGVGKEKPSSSCKGEIQDVLDKINGGEEIVLDDENILKATNLQTLSHHITNLVSRFKEPEKVRISYVLNGIKQDDNLESLMKRLDVQFKVISEKDVKETITPETLQKYGISGLENDIILSKNKTPLDLNSFTILKLNDLEDDKFNSQSSVDYSKYEIVKSVTKDSEDEHSNNPTIEDISIVGSTQTGKDIHTSRPASHGFYKGWTSQDHQDASDILMGLRGPDDAVANSHSIVSQNLRNGILS